ncbi:MAG: glutaminase A [Cytophagales bacterium]|nr:glutaminase A [Armatimonadota bacterium]
MAFLRGLHAKYLGLTEGSVADYIPELAKADPEWFGIALVTGDGRVFEVGSSRQQFTIQSISKPFTYGLALEEHGVEQVLARVGVEPTGDAFNSIVLDKKTGRPLNPMVNAGAIAVTDLVPGENATERLHRTLDLFRRYVGHADLFIDVATFTSERTSSHRNRAIAHLMRGANVLSEHVDETLDLYFQQCSILVNCRDLAVMAATLANAGENPLTGERAVANKQVKHILSVMYTCGMYDSAGEWAFRVGLPAKSGVAGGILAVVPGQLGIAIFSPRVDAHGNSVRGIKVCEEISDRFGLHLFSGRNCRTPVI